MQLHQMHGSTKTIDVDKPKTIKELRDFLASIPEDKWCVKKRGILGTDIHCAVGHMVAAFMDYYDLCKVLKISPNELILHNDYHWEGPKKGVLLYLDKHISD